MRIAGLCLVLVLGAAAAPASLAAPPRVLVTFEKTGGFAGIERGLVVHRSGRVVSDGLAVRTHQLAPARLRALREALVKARFATLSRTYESATPVSDGFVYGITYGGRVVRVEEGAELPARLRRLFTLLAGIVEE